MSDRTTPEADAEAGCINEIGSGRNSYLGKNEHRCTMQPTMNLRWKVRSLYPLMPEDRKLEQVFICRVCGEMEWREVPEVKEEA